MVERITESEYQARLRAQGVSSADHCAFVCPICGTVQSMASLVRAGANAARVENAIGFSCEGRLTNAGPAALPLDRSVKAKKRRALRGCDWTLGGLFRLHKLEVTLDGENFPRFQLATPEQAQGLEASMALHRMVEAGR